MTNKEAIEMFKAGIAATDCEKKKDLYETAIAALEKHIPKKVYKIFQEKTRKPIAFWCPTCGKSVLGSGFYCWNCGQHLDWGEKI